jgi:hypothetical protein
VIIALLPIPSWRDFGAGDAAITDPRLERRPVLEVGVIDRLAANQRAVLLRDQPRDRLAQDLFGTARWREWNQQRQRLGQCDDRRCAWISHLKQAR